MLIENQLERSDHTHLGQLITYTAGLDTATIVWIVAEFTGEHRAALDWLNGATDDHFRFFGLEVQLWRIGDSIEAPAFRIACQPNAWTKQTRETSRTLERGELSELGRQRLAYWKAFREFLIGTSCPLRMARDYGSGHVPFAIPQSPFVLIAYRSVHGPGVFVRVRAQEPSLVACEMPFSRSEAISSA